MGILVHGLRRRHGRGEGGARWRIVVGGVERRGHRVGVVEVRVGGVLRHERRPDGREAKVLLEGTGRTYDGVFVELEGVDGEGDLRLRVAEGGRLHGLVQRVVMQGDVVVRVARHHDAVHGRDLRRGLCSSLGGLIRD